MALVDYVSSDEEVEAEESARSSANDKPSQSLKRKHEESSSDLPPLPSKFHDLYASTTRVSTRDDPSLHGGRKRVTPHVEGNWPTHLYIEWYPSTTEYSSLNALISSLKGNSPEAANLKIQSLLTSDLGAPLPLHISLSRSIGFSTEQKDAFVVSMERTVRSSAIRPLVISFTDLDWVPNFERTRWFLVLKVQKPNSDALNKLLHISNGVVQEHGQPPLYSKHAITISDIKPPTHPEKRQSTTGSLYKDMQDLSPAFHISIAWTLTAPTQELLELTKSATINHFEIIKQIQPAVDDIKVKVGNVVTTIHLPKSVSFSKNLFGI